jgi:hypothetical protein
MSNIDEIIALLDWNRDSVDQEKGLVLARDVECIKAFFQPSGRNYGKNVWDNCAVIICERSDAELNYYILDMLLWLEDLNWPGAELIQQRLIRFCDVQMLAMWLNSVVPQLYKLGMRSWLFFIAPLLENSFLVEKLNSETLCILRASQTL